MTDPALTVYVLAVDILRNSNTSPIPPSSVASQLDIAASHPCGPVPFMDASVSVLQLIAQQFRRSSGSLHPPSTSSPAIHLAAHMWLVLVPDQQRSRHPDVTASAHIRREPQVSKRQSKIQMSMYIDFAFHAHAHKHKFADVVTVAGEVRTKLAGAADMAYIQLWPDPLTPNHVHAANLTTLARVTHEAELGNSHWSFTSPIAAVLPMQSQTSTSDLEAGVPSQDTRCGYPRVADLDEMWTLALKTLAAVARA
ncbi:hypothetical protein B0H11DRAFT_2267512 [Mycena galericulata]|nr:hypothetical protein B0H11DRAFT_2267512 [Mycena galericulata]